MKKLKKFCLNSMQILSCSEMEKIEGKDFMVYDYCDEHNYQAICLVNLGTNGNHQIAELGVCRLRTMPGPNGGILPYYVCE